MDAKRIDEFTKNIEIIKLDTLLTQIDESMASGDMMLEVKELTDLEKEVLIEKGFVLKELTHKTRISWHNKN